MLKPIIAGALLCLAATAADAKTFTLGEGGATIDMPASWKPNEIDSGVEGTSDDGSIYIAAEVVAAADMDAAIEDEFKFLQKEKITLKKETQQQRDIKSGDLPGVILTWDGTDPTGPARIGVVIHALYNNKALLVTYWGTPSGVAANEKETDAIMDSIKILK